FGISGNGHESIHGLQVFFLQQFYISTIAINDKGIGQFICQIEGLFLIFLDQLYAKPISTKIPGGLETYLTATKYHNIFDLLFLLAGKFVQFIQPLFGSYKIYLIIILKNGIS